MIRATIPQLKKCLALLTLLAVLFLMFFPLSALAAERYQILKLGDKDDYVLALQEKLKDIGFFSGSATGYYGTVTQQAVMDYQKSKKLAVDGKAGPQTLKSIMGDNFEISQDRVITDSQGNQDADFPGPGDKGDTVSQIQQRLKDLGYYDYPTITGYYGPVTQKAVMRFQSTNSLKEDGIAGPETMDLLNSDDVKYYCICAGDSGSNVSKLQERLKKLDYFEGNVTGYFGTLTTHALKEFQAQNRLAVDAKAGQNTRDLLFSKNAPKWDGKDRVAGENAEAQSTASIEKMITFASKQLGKPYVYATEGPGSFDCSGFVYYVLKYMGVSTTRYSADGFSKVESWIKISDRNTLVPGDLLFFTADSGSRINHTGIYLGDNQFIHASSSGECVRISTLKDYYDRNFSLARRIF